MGVDIPMREMTRLVWSKNPLVVLGRQRPGVFRRRREKAGRDRQLDGCREALLELFETGRRLLVDWPNSPCAVLFRYFPSTERGNGSIERVLALDLRDRLGSRALAEECLRRSTPVGS